MTISTTLADPRQWPSSRRPMRSRVVRELVEEVLVVLRAGRGFGVELHRENGQRVVRQPLDAAVREIDMADVEAAGRRDALRLDLKVMVLRRDGDTARTLLADGMIRAVVAERQPARARARRQREDLV